MLEKFTLYLETERRFSEHTVKAYLNDVSDLLEFSEVSRLSEISEVTHQLIRAWIVHLVESGMDNRSVNRKLSSLRTFYKWGVEEGLVDKNPLIRIKGPRQSKRLPEFVKESEMTATNLEAIYVEGFQGLRDRVMVELFYQTGIRLAELVGLKESDLQNGSIKVLGKRNKERIIPITAGLNELLKEYIHSKKHMGFYNAFLLVTDKGNNLYPKFAYRKINYYLSHVTNLKKRSPHILRHTFATHMLNNGAGLESLKEILGHANLSATQVYTHNSFDKLTSIYKQAHPRGRKTD